MSYERNKMIALLYRIFQAEDYRWLDSKESPTVEEIEDTILGLEANARKSKGSSATGRILVKYDVESDFFEYYLEVGCSL